MSRASVVARGRLAAEAGMTDACIITREDPAASAPVPDATTLVIPPKARIVIYSGKCQFQTSALLSSNSSSEAGERKVGVQATMVKLPFSEPTAGDVASTDVVEVVTCVSNPALEGRMPTIVGKEALKSHATAHRFVLNEVGA